MNLILYYLLKYYPSIEDLHCINKDNILIKQCTDNKIIYIYIFPQACF